MRVVTNLLILIVTVSIITLSLGSDYDVNDAATLHQAIRNGQLDVLEDLLARAASLTEPDEQGWTPLHLAAMKCNSANNTAMAEKILRSVNDDPANLLRKVDNNGRTPLELAVHQNCRELVKLFLSFSDEACLTKSKDGLTPIQVAKELGLHILVEEMTSASSNCSIDQDACGNLHCDSLPEVKNGDVVEKDSDCVGTKTKVRCFEGFKLVGSGLAVCQENGRWQIDGYCRKVRPCSPDSLPSIPNGVIVLETTSNDLPRNFTCDAGYLLVGYSSISCNDELGSWVAAGSCKKESQEATVSVLHGSLGESSGSSYSYDDDSEKRILSCDDGYSLQGSDVVQRNNNDGKWLISGFCAPNSCGQLPAIENGVVSSSGKQSWGVVGESTTFSCKTRFQLSGSNRIVCMADLTWLVNGFCLADSCGDVPVLENGWFSNGSNAVGAVRFAACNEGFGLTDNRTMMCTSDGSWAFETTCQKVTTNNELFVAAENGDFVRIQRLVKENGADVNAKLGSNGLTALIIAARFGHVDAVRLLVDLGALPDLKTTTKTADTALIFTAANNHSDIVRVLVEQGGADVKLKNADGLNALYWAAINGLTDSVRILLEHGSDANVQDNHGSSPLIRACKNSHAEIARLLIEEGKADVGVKNNFGDTALLSCAANGLTNAVKLLLERGADVNVKTENGATPLSLAESRGHHEIFSFLKEKMSPTFSIDNGNLEDSIGDDGAQKAISCNSGYRLMGSAIVRVVDRGLVVNGFCGAETCQQPPPIENAVLANSKYNEYDASENDTRPWKIGDSTTFTCNTGFKLLGSDQIVCGPDLNWLVKGFCAAERCGDLPKLENGIFSTGSNLIGAIRFASCNTGFGLKANPTVTCNSDGRWLVETSCQKVTAKNGLFVAAQAGDLERIGRLVEEDAADVNAIRGSDGSTALVIATEFGKVDAVRLLIDLGALPDLKTTTTTALIVAASNNHSEIVRVLVEQGGADAMIKNDDGLNALYFAANNNLTETVRLLLRSGSSDVNVQDSAGFTPLMVACKRGYDETARLLIEEGRADVNFRSKQNETALTLAAETGLTDIVKLLLERGADPTDEDAKAANKIIASLLKEKVKSIYGRSVVIGNGRISESQQEFSCNPGYSLHGSNTIRLTEEGWLVNGFCAAKNCGRLPKLANGKISAESSHIGAFRFASCKEGFGLTDNRTIICNWDGSWKMEASCQKVASKVQLFEAAQEGDLPRMRRLVKEEAADVNAKRSEDGVTALMIAVQSGQVEAIRLLIDFGALPDLTSTSESADTALILAAFNNQTDIVRLLIEQGEANVLVKSGNGLTALYWLVKNGLTESIRLLLQVDSSDVNAQDDNGFSLLMLNKDTEVARLLIEEGRADVNLRNSRNETALTWSITNGLTDLVKLLLERGADVNVKTESGATPLSLAEASANKQIVSLLKEKMPLMTPIIENGRIFEDHLNGQHKINCNPGYQLIGSAAVRLNDDARWRIRGFCLREQCDDLPTLENGQISLGDSSIGSTRLLTCNQGFNPSGPRTVKCEVGGSWNLKTSCKKVKFMPELLEAAKTGNVDQIEQLLSQDADLEGRDEDGFTALMVAAANGKTDAVRLLLDLGVDVNAASKSGQTALIGASANNSHTEIVSLLLDRGADLHGRTSEAGNTALIMAAEAGHLETVRLLLDGGADVNAKANSGETALILATQGNPEIVELLLDRGANVNALPMNGFTALHWAVIKNFSDVARLLIERGANVNQKSSSKSQSNALMLAAISNNTEIMLLLVEEGGANVNIRNSHNATALSLAVKNGLYDAVKLLLANGADVNMKSEDGWTAVDLAESYRHMAIVDLLSKRTQMNPRQQGIVIEHGQLMGNELSTDKSLKCNPGYQVQGSSVIRWSGAEWVVGGFCARECGQLPALENGQFLAGDSSAVGALRLATCNEGFRPTGPPTATCGVDGSWRIKITCNKAVPSLKLAAKGGKARLIEGRLPQQGADVDGSRSNNIDFTQFIMAVNSGDMDAVRRLLRRGADVNATFNSNNDTPLILSMKLRNMQMVRLLVEEGGANVDLGNNLNETPLHWAAENGLVDAARLLISRGCNVNSVNKKGYSALMIAAQRGHEQIVRLILDSSDVDVNAQNDFRDTALHWVASKGLVSSVRMLLQHGANPDLRNADGLSPRLAALESGNKQVADLFRNLPAYRPGFFRRH